MKMKNIPIIAENHNLCLFFVENAQYLASPPLAALETPQKSFDYPSPFNLCWNCYTRECPKELTHTLKYWGKVA